ncbi:tail fiber protein, partial [Escherichia coli]
ATTARKGLVQLSSATNSDSETLAATPKAVKTAYDLANGKYTAQDATTA